MKTLQLASLTILSGLIIHSTIIANPSKALVEPISNQQQQITAQSNNIVAIGDFVTADRSHPTTGKARIVNQNGQLYLEFDPNFATANGPEVKVILHRSNQVPVKINEPDYITLAPLESFNGYQRYLIPADVNINEFESVAIWCRRFNVTFGYVTL